MNELYTLTVSKSDDQGTANYEQTLTANSAEEFKRIAQLAGILPSGVDAPVQSEVPACECPAEPHGDCGCACHDVPTVEVPDTPYDGEDVYSPDYKMDNWQSRSYEKFVKTPSAEWPKVFEELSEDLVSNFGLTREEAEEKVLETMSLDLSECFDYGHRNMRFEQSKMVPAGHNIDAGMSKHLKQKYVQSRFTDNPLNPIPEETGKNFEKLYLDFIREQTSIDKLK